MTFLVELVSVSGSYEKSVLLTLGVSPSVTMFAVGNANEPIGNGP